jgi:hypothetical protein
MLNDNSKTNSHHGNYTTLEPDWSPQSPAAALKIKPTPWMHLRAKRLTVKYRASKMFLLPNPLSVKIAAPGTLSSATVKVAHL